MVEFNEYRLAFVLPQSGKILALQGDDVPKLPVISIPAWERPPQQLTKAIKDKWNIKTVILGLASDNSLATRRCAFVEVRSSDWHYIGNGLYPVLPNCVDPGYLGNKEQEALNSILTGEAAECDPFSRIGWVEEAQHWIQSSVKQYDVVFNDDVRHFNASGRFCLIRFGTVTGPAFWLKAVGDPNAQEFSITKYLAKKCPEYLPRIVATRSDWNAWVMEEVGSSLHRSNSLEDFERAMRTLAHLQKTLVGSSGDLLAASCADHQPAVLEAHIDDVIVYLKEAMALQSSTTVPRLSEADLTILGETLHARCSALRDLGIPSSLLHGDISPGSILSNGVDCVFTDWCEGYVGNPFITCEQLCAHIARKTQQVEMWTERLRSIYRSCWLDFLTEIQIAKVFEIVPLISIFSYLYGRGDCLHSQRRYQQNFLSYSRSLARHMNRIVTSPRATETLCHSNKAF